MASQAAQKEPEETFLRLHADGWVAIFTLVLTVATGLLWWSTEKTIAHARKSSELQLRAYIGVVGGVVRYLDGSRPVEVEIKFRNAGQTPAHKTSVKGGCFLFPYPGDPTFRDLSHHIYAPKTVLPGGEILKREEADIPAVRLANLLAGHDTLFVYGKVAYEDVFGQPHFTNYRLQVGGRQRFYMTQKNGLSVSHLGTCEEGNDSD